MSRMSRTLALFAALVISVVPASSATLDFFLTPSLQAGAGGGSVVFQGTLANFTTSDLFLNDFDISFTPPAGTYLADDHNFFFFNVPGVLEAGETYTGPIFRLLIAPATPPGAYFGSATILGGADEFTFDPIASQSFEVSLVPEPATMATTGLMLAGLGIALAGYRSRRTISR
jgi:hypothetical protein